MANFSKQQTEWVINMKFKNLMLPSSYNEIVKHFALCKKYFTILSTKKLFQKNIINETVRERYNLLLKYSEILVNNYELFTRIISHIQPNFIEKKIPNHILLILYKNQEYLYLQNKLILLKNNNKKIYGKSYYSIPSFCRSICNEYNRKNEKKRLKFKPTFTTIEGTQILVKYCGSVPVWFLQNKNGKVKPAKNTYGYHSYTDHQIKILDKKIKILDKKL